MTFFILPSQPRSSFRKSEQWQVRNKIFGIAIIIFGMAVATLHHGISPPVRLKTKVGKPREYFFSPVNPEETDVFLTYHLARDQVSSRPKAKVNKPQKCFLILKQTNKLFSHMTLRTVERTIERFYELYLLIAKCPLKLNPIKEY